LKNLANIVFHEIRPVGAKLFHADRRTDTTKLIPAFRNFAKAPKKTEGEKSKIMSVTKNIL